MELIFIFNDQRPHAGYVRLIKEEKSVFNHSMARLEKTQARHFICSQ